MKRRLGRSCALGVALRLLAASCFAGCAAHQMSPFTDGADASDAAADTLPSLDASIDSPPDVGIDAALDATGDPIALPDWYPLTQVACDADAGAATDPVDGTSSDFVREYGAQPAQPLEVPCPDPTFQTACRWEPGPAIPLSLRGWYVDTVVSASDGLYFGSRDDVPPGQFGYFYHLGYDGTVLSMSGGGDCGCSGPVINVALGHGLLIHNFFDGDLAVTDSGWSTLDYRGYLTLFNGENAQPPTPLGGPMHEGSPLRAIFDDHTFLFLSGWSPLQLQHLAANGTSLAAPVSIPIVGDAPVVWEMLAIGQVVLIAWPALLGGIRGLFVGADGDVLVPQFAIPGPNAIAFTTDLVAHSLGLYSARGEALITYSADMGPSPHVGTVLQTIGLDGTPIGEYVTLPESGGLQVARTPTGEIMIEQHAAYPLTCVPL